jgi:hypothetical protein
MSMKPASSRKRRKGACRLVAQLHVLLHLRTAQVDYPVLQADTFRQVLFVKLKRRRRRSVENLHLMTENLDFTAGDVGVHRSFGTGANLARNAQAELVAHPFGGREHFRAIRVADDLGQALAVAQVDKDDAAVVSPPMRPAAKPHFLADEL